MSYGFTQTDMFHVSDMLSKEEFHLKQNVEPFIHYREKHTTFECITRENIEAVAAKVPPSVPASLIFSKHSVE